MWQDGFLSEDEFATMSPALVLMALKGCGEHAHDDDHEVRAF
jgi:hypothetical protein